MDSRTLGFAERVGLLVVDTTRGFTDSSSPFACDMDAVLPVIAGLLDSARSGACPVAFTRVVHAEPLSPGARIFQSKVPALAELTDSSTFVEFDPTVAPVAGEPVFTKQLPSAFAERAVHDWVRQHRLGGLVVVGASTSGCVRATVVDGMQHGLRMFIAADGVGDRDPDSHASTLRDLGQRYGDVGTGEEGEARLRAGNRAARGVSAHATSEGEGA